MALGKVRKSQGHRHTKERWKEKWCGAGRTDQRRRMHAFLRKERATDRESMWASERDRKTGRELMLTNKPKETKGRPLSLLLIMEAR